MINNHKIEMWLPINGYEGKYEISSKGRVKSLIKWNGREYIRSERIIKGWIGHSYKSNYKRKLVALSKNKNKKTFKVHRLVAEAFLERVEGKNKVNHIDGNPLNNDVNNLEWCDQKRNMEHAYETGLANSNLHKYKKELIKECSETNISLRSLAKKYKCSDLSLKKMLVANGVRIKSNSEIKNIYGIDKQKLTQDFINGERNVDIAQKYNMNRHLIGVYKYKYKRGELIWD